EPTMSPTSTSSPRLTLDIDVTDLSDEQRRKFTETITDLLEEYRNYEDDEPTVRGWSAATLQNALTRLERDGGWVQAGAIRKALANGGTVSRAEIYAIGNYSADRMLRGFTRPANRIVAQMRAAGEIPSSAVDLLEPIYDRGVVADGFRVPSDLATLIVAQ
ncbi:MAG: hypothetical protein WCC38_14105, partial [Pseudonocardiaceae bacterium]